MLKNLINELVLPKVKDFTAMMGKAGKRTFAAGQLTVDDVNKQLIYTATLQIKAYFSLLFDIADMYCTIDRDYIVKGLDLCGQLSKIAASKSDTGPALAQLTSYNEESTTAVNKLVSDVWYSRSCLRTKANTSIVPEPDAGRAERPGATGAGYDFTNRRRLCKGGHRGRQSQECHQRRSAEQQGRR